MKTILSFNGSKFFEKESSAVLKQIALTLMSFSQGNENKYEGQGQIKFVIEAEEKKREEITQFLLKNNIDNYQFLNKYIKPNLDNFASPPNGFVEVPLNESLTPTKQSCPELTESYSSPSISIDTSIRNDKEISEYKFYKKAVKLKNLLISEEKFHFFHLDHDNEYQGGVIDAGDVSCFVINDEKENIEMLKTAANKIGLKNYANIIKRSENPFNSGDNKNLLKDLAAIRYLLQIHHRGAHEEEALINLVIAFHLTYDRFLTKTQKEYLIFIERKALGDTFVNNSILHQQWAVQKFAKGTLDRLGATQDLTTLLDFTQFLFPFLSPIHKKNFLDRYVNDQFISQTIENSKLNNPTSQAAEKRIITTNYTLAIEKDPKHKTLSDTVKKVLEDQITQQKEKIYYDNIKETSVFNYIPIIGFIFISFVSLFYKPSKENAYQPPKISRSKYRFLQTKFSSSTSTSTQKSLVI